ncbi:MAG TPA: hypothetical protein VJJ47_02990 [Candidatus Paceibacterota bacterium]
MFREEPPAPLASTRDLREYLARQVDLAVQLFNRDSPSAVPGQNIEEAAMHNWVDRDYSKRFHDEVVRREQSGAPWPTLEDLERGAPGEGERKRAA